MARFSSSTEPYKSFPFMGDGKFSLLKNLPPLIKNKIKMPRGGVREEGVVEMDTARTQSH